jgi:hypothetical protein
MSLPPDLLRLARQHRLRQQDLARRAATVIGRLWRSVSPRAALTSWRSGPGPDAVRTVTVAQAAAAAGADAYVSAAMSAQGVTGRPAGLVVAQMLAGVASDGRDLGSLLEQPAIVVDALVADGMAVSVAARVGAERLDRIVATQVADAARVATGVSTAASRADGYIRMLTPPSCSRCALLAGRWYPAATAFTRHPRCDCVHIPALEDLRSEVTSPEDYFASLPEAEQDRIFTIAGAQAIRDGADIGRIVNARRGANGLAPAGGRLTAEELRLLRGGRERGRLQRVDVGGRQLFVTTELRRRRRPPRLMPESIYELADGDRGEALRLLKAYGYIL